MLLTVAMTVAVAPPPLDEGQSPLDVDPPSSVVGVALGVV